MSTARFRIAFSFAGEKRDFVEKVAGILALRFGRDAILYDKYHEAEFARHDLGIYLPKLYGKQSDLVVPVLCPKYDAKRWTGWEWLHIYGMLTKEDGHRVMPSRFEYAEADGLSPAAGFIELDNKTPEQFVSLILERLALNEGKSRDFYQLLASVPSSRTFTNLPGIYSGSLFLGRDGFLRDLRASLLKKTHTTAITHQAAATGIAGLGGHWEDARGGRICAQASGRIHRHPLRQWGLTGAARHRVRRALRRAAARRHNWGDHRAGCACHRRDGLARQPSAVAAYCR